MPVPGPSPFLAAVVAAAMTVILWVLGHRLLRLWWPTLPARAAVPASLSLGLTVAGVVTWTVGAVVGTTGAYVVAAVGGIFGLSGARKWLTDLLRVVRHTVALLRANPVAALGLVVTIVLILPQAAMPLVDSDGLRYHVALAKLYVLQGHIGFYPWDVHAAFPQAAEALYLLGLPVGGGEVAKWLHTAAFLAALQVLGLLLHQSRASRRAAVLGPWLFAASPVAAVAAGSAFIDHFVLLHLGAAAVLARRHASPVLIGVCLAGALATKWSAAPALLGLGLLVWGRRRWRLAPVVALAAPVLVAVTPFTVRNLVTTGDPVFPVGYGLVREQVPGVAEERYAYVTQVHEDVPGPFGIPWGSGLPNVQSDQVVGWHLLLGLVALPLLLKPRRPTELLALAVPYLAVGLVYHPATRLAMPMLWAFAGAAGLVLGRIARPWAALLAVVLVAPAAVTTTRVVTGHGPAIPHLLGHVSSLEAQRRTVPGAAAAELVNAQPAGERVMALDFPAPYLFDRPWIAEGILNRPPLVQWVREGADAADLLRRLRRLDVRYLVVTPGYGGGGRWSLVIAGRTPRERAALAGLRRRLALVGIRDSVDVYRVPPPSTSP